MSGPVVTKAANAQFPGARVELPKYALHLIVAQAVARAMGRAMGGLWVGGRLRLSATELGFEPNSLNRGIHEGETSFRVALDDVVAVETRRAC